MGDRLISWMLTSLTGLKYPTGCDVGPESSGAKQYLAGQRSKGKGQMLSGNDLTFDL
jgi:hypothetical protein